MSDLPENHHSYVQPAALLIVGASTRAAAWSAVRAGWQPLCSDMFADVDLAAYARVVADPDYPSGLEAISRGAPSGPWMFTGGLENQPALIQRIGRQRTLWGNGADVLRRVRDPFMLAEALAGSGIETPPLRPTFAGLPTDGTWLVKPRRGSGGTGIQPWHGQPHDAALDRTHYFEQRVAGESWSAAYVAAGGQARLIGVSEQVVGDGVDAAGQFRYRGSLGPLALSDALHAEYERLGAVLATKFKLVGWFGVDTIVRHQRVWPIEVNPRYTASMEIFDYATGVALFEWHVQACRDAALPRTELSFSPNWHGKRVIYAKRDVQASAELAHLDVRPLDNERLWQPIIADIPMAGTRIPRRHPVLTIFASGRDRAEVGRRLDELEWRVEAALYGAD